ncbi:hypothetical protein A3L09_09310 [Thermococcus profundus]|uniref:Uncharacterized protein n=1 Tax=Thermococcus profundus TaxID=49899 RepID=A0A2Z2MHN3_THEPR|nr:hypothetical protein [Thermococcus profundus]ASJ03444.1 hypothetical protein A3L09_09310 [Thermococcus profundus]
MKEITPVPVRGIVLSIRIKDLPEYHGLLSEEFSAFIPDKGIVLPSIENTEEPLHPEILESYENRKPVEFVLELVPEAFKITEGEETIEYVHYHPTKRYYGRRIRVNWNMMRGFIRSEIKLRGKITRIGREYSTSLNQYGDYVLEVFPLGVPVYVKLPPREFRRLKPGVGDVIEASAFWFYSRVPGDESVRIWAVNEGEGYYEGSW